MSLINPPYRKLKQWVLGVTIFLLFYTLIGFFLLPWIITSQVPSLIKESLGRDASLQEATFNPYTLELDLKGFEMLEHDSQPFASFEHLYINYGLWSSLSHLSVALQQISLEKPYGHVAILKDGSFNFSDLSKESEENIEEKEDEDDGLFPVWVGHLAINDGSVLFEDHSLKIPFKENIQQLNLQINDLTTKKDGKTPYTINLALNSGAHLTINGSTVLDPLAAQGKLQLSTLSLHKVWEYLRDNVDFELQKGNLNLDMRYAFNGGDKNRSIIDVKDGWIVLDDFRLVTTSGDPAKLDLTKFKISGLAVNMLNENQKQSIDITVPSVKSSDTRVDIQGADALSITIPDLALTDTDINIGTSETTSTAIKINNQQFTISQIDLETSGIRELFVRINSIAFDHFNMDIANSDDSDQAIMQLNNQSLTLDKTNIGSTTDNVELIKIPSIKVDNLAVDIQNQSVKIADVSSGQAEISSSLSKNGELNLQTLFAGKSVKTTPETTDQQTNNSTDQASKKSWTVAVNNLAITKYRFELEDKNTRPIAKHLLDPINLTVNQFSTDSGKPFQLSFDAGVNQKGKFSSKGLVGIEPLSVKLDVAANKIALDALQPYINDFAHLKIKKGLFNMKGKLDLAGHDSSKTSGSFKGNASINRLHTVDTIDKKDFLKLKALNVNRIAFNLEPMKLAIHDVVTDGLYNRITIHKDKTTNIGEIFPSSKNTESKDKKKRSTSQNKDKADVMPLKIGAVKIKNSAALFSDSSLVLPFTLNMTDLNGNIKDISSSVKQTASVRIDGKVNRISPVIIEGSLKPFDIEQFLDVKLNVKDVDLTAITPYMAQFAGYAIDKGKINLDLEYKVENKKLLADNKVVIDQLTLGEEIKSPDAVSLPVKLAIGLLQDQNGVIDLNLPMQGSLDDPKFSIAALIGKVLLNLLTKAATSPFSLIGGLVGSGEDLNNIVFQRGVSTLNEAQIEKLSKIAEALKERPKLKIEIKGVALSETDRLGLKENQLLQRMKKEKWEDIEGNDNAPSKPELIELTDQEIRKMIIDYYEDEIPDAPPLATTQLADGEEVITEEAYQMARKRLLDQIKVTDIDLQQLAQQRANNIAHQLIKVGGLPANRVFVLKEQIEQQTEPGTQETVSVELALSAS